MKIIVSKREEIVIFRLKGRFIGPTNRKVLETVNQTLCGLAKFPKLLFDFKKVTRVDCAGLGTLMRINAQILQRGGRLAIINMNKHVRNVTVMTRLSTVLKCFETEEDAITALLEES